MQRSENRFTRGEYWVLESVVEHPCPLRWLAGDDETVSIRYNKTGHGLDRAAIVEALERLIGDGLIGVSDPGEKDPLDVPFVRTLDRRGIESGLEESAEDPSTHYGLTIDGGLAWEAFARPDWDAYVDLSSRPSSYRNMSLGMLTAATLWRAERILEGGRYLGHFFDPSRVRWRVLRPWRATYWKALPEGHRAIYRFVDASEWTRFDDASHGFMAMYENREWYHWK